MKRTLLILLLATALSGCFGAPAGTPQIGDSVTVNWAAYDLHSGIQIASGDDLSFVVGSGASGLGRDFERHLIGQQPDQELTFESETDPSRPYGAIVKTSRTQLEPFEAVQDIDVPTFTNAIGEPTVGMAFDVSFYQGVVRAVNDGTVTYEIVPAHGQRDAVDFVGIILVTEVHDGMIHQTLEADEGATFDVSPPSPFGGGPPLAGLEPGSYRTRGMTATDILYDFTSNPVSADLARPLRFVVTITAVEPAAPQEFDAANFVARDTPVLLADPAAVTLLVGTSSAPDSSGHAVATEGDGHDDGHTH